MRIKHSPVVLVAMLMCQQVLAQALPEAPPAPPMPVPVDAAVSNPPPVAPAVPALPVPPAMPSAAQLAEEAEALAKANKPADAREKWLAALAVNPDAGLRAKVENRLGEISLELIRKPWPMPEKVDYVVQAGDSIRSIANKHGTTVEMIVQANELKRPDIINPGKRLRVFTGKMAMAVDKSENDLLLTANGRFFKRYRVGTGKYDRTPVGTFTVSDRIKEPVWWRDDGKTVPFGDKENILGTRWMTLKAAGDTPAVTGYGIHGTWEDNSIGKSESAGCIRMKNTDVEELFELVPVGTAVTIEE